MRKQRRIVSLNNCADEPKTTASRANIKEALAKVEAKEALSGSSMLNVRRSTKAAGVDLIALKRKLHSDNVGFKKKERILEMVMPHITRMEYNSLRFAVYGYYEYECESGYYESIGLDDSDFYTEDWENQHSDEIIIRTNEEVELLKRLYDHGSKKDIELDAEEEAMTIATTRKKLSRLNIYECQRIWQDGDRQLGSKRRSREIRRSRQNKQNRADSIAA